MRLRGSTPPFVGEPDDPETDGDPETPEQRILRHLAQGRFKQALGEADSSPSAALRQQFRVFRKIVSEPPFNCPPLDAVRDPQTGRWDVQEVLDGPQGEPVGLSVDLSGLGVQQGYVMLASILFGRTRVVGLEEPEAHLHAPTTGRNVRALLKRLVDEGVIDQLFVATHSNLFDLDEREYFHVERDASNATTVERRPLATIDRDHLYEPGPSKHALTDLLNYLPPVASPPSSVPTARRSRPRRCSISCSSTTRTRSPTCGPSWPRRCRWSRPGRAGFGSEGGGDHGMRIHSFKWMNHENAAKSR